MYMKALFLFIFSFCLSLIVKGQEFRYLKPDTISDNNEKSSVWNEK